MDKIFKIFIILFTNTFCIWQFYNRKNAIYFNIVKESDYAHSILRPVCALLFSGKAKASNEPFQTWMDGLTLDNTPLLLLKECVPLIFISISLFFQLCFLLKWCSEFDCSFNVPLHFWAHNCSKNSKKYWERSTLFSLFYMHKTLTI